jgi:hypothetical protein
MKLSDLVTFRNQLKELDINQARDHTRLDLEKFKHITESNPVKIGDYQSQLDTQCQQILNQISQFGSTVDQLYKEISLLIEQVEKPYFLASYRLYEEMCNSDEPDYILKRRVNLDAQAEEFFTSRIKFYTDWQYPGMIIRPGLESFTKHLVSYDPLYLVDTDSRLLDPAMAQFTPEYQRRLRPYVISESVDSPMLHKIPNHQFGFCLIYNFFSFKPLEIIRGYLQEVYEKLRPGGVLIFTFNDCDRPAGVDLCERSFACYMTGGLMESLITSIGYEKTFRWNDNGPVTWFEVQKPGELSTIRGGQTLARVLPKSLARSK